MTFKEIIELAKTGVDIKMHLMTFSAMSTYVRELKPYGYHITDVMDYRYNNPNCTFVKAGKSK